MDHLKTFVVPGSSSGMKTGDELQFIFKVGPLFRSPQDCRALVPAR